MMTSNLRILVLVCLMAVQAPGFGADDSVLFVGPSGSLPAVGTRADPLRDLQAAVDKAQAMGSKVARVEVRVLPGAYRGQTVTIKSADGNTPRIEIRRDADDSRPVFDGDGTDNTWLTVVSSGKPVKGLTVYGLKVTGYSTAITLNGSRDNASQRIDDVVIRNNVFAGIGQLSPNQRNYSTAAVRLINAHGVQIINNNFSQIRNRERCKLIHAIYVAHGSTDNVIKDNDFQDTCGDAVRFRDASSDNKVEDNNFTDAWVDAPISDWYCDGTNRQDCTKKTAECPSFGNIISGNKVKALRASKPEMTTAFGTDTNAACDNDRATRAQAASRKRFEAR